MSNEQQPPSTGTVENIANENQALAGALSFYDLHKEKIFGALAILILIPVLFYGYINFYKAPREIEAQEEIFKAQRYFERDSFSLALKGGPNFSGFESLMSDYSGTDAGHLAKFYAAICYLNLGQKDEALNLIQGYSSPSPVVQALALGLEADLISEKDDKAKAIALYERAASTADNATAAVFLFKAARLLEIQKDQAAAKAMYERLLKEYPLEADQMQIEDKHLSRVLN